MLRRFANAIAGTVGAVLFAQFPEFYQQYLQSLNGGRIALSELVQDLTASSAQALNKLEALTESVAALRDSVFWQQPFVFLQNLHFSYLFEARDLFKPALPITLAGLFYALIGVIAGIGVWGLLELIGRGLRTLGRRQQSRRMLQRPVS